MIISEFSQVGGMRVHDLVRQKVLNGVFVSEDAHDNVRAGLRHLHLMVAVIRRPVEDVGINREYVGKWYCFPCDGNPMLADCS